MHYFFLGGWFRLYYAYVDLNRDCDYVADSLFYKRKVPVHFTNELRRDGDEYRVIICRIPRKFRKLFEEALEELKTKMCLLGHNDYEEYCKNLKAELKE